MYWRGEQGKPIFGYLSLIRSIRIERQRRAVKAPPSRKGGAGLDAPLLPGFCLPYMEIFVYFCVRFFFYLREPAELPQPAGPGSGSPCTGQWDCHPQWPGYWVSFRNCWASSGP